MFYHSKFSDQSGIEFEVTIGLRNDPEVIKFLILLGINQWQCKPMVNFKDCIIWVCNIMTHEWCMLLVWRMDHESWWSRWWFQPSFIFTTIWGRFPIWLIFFRCVETTNQWLHPLLLFRKGHIFLGGCDGVLGVRSSHEQWIRRNTDKKRLDWLDDFYQCWQEVQTKKTLIHSMNGTFTYIWHEFMDVSENNGTPKSSILIGFSVINHPLWGTPYFWKHPYGKCS